MKKLLLFTCLALLTCSFAIAKGNKGNGHKQNSAGSAFSSDIIIDNSSIDQSIVKLATAFNGWQYAAMSSFDFNTFEGSVTIKSSKDGGITWTTIDSYSDVLLDYTALDLVVAGTDTNNLTLFLAGVNLDMGNNIYSLYVDKYDGRTGTWSGTNYSVTNSDGPISDVSIASDYAFPAVGANPYSVGLLYSSASAIEDSMVFAGSTDGGANWDIYQTIATTTDYFRKVSLAYGRSASASNGRYIGAWESLTSRANTTGNIYTSRCGSLINSAWLAPIALDSIAPERYGLCRNPSIAVSYGNNDNDSSSITAVILVDFDINGDESDFDLVGFYNKRAHMTDYWFDLDVLSSVENDIQPDIAYNTGTSSFAATYFNMTDMTLPYITNGVNLALPDDWTYVSDQYNDATGGLNNPMPQVSINPFSNRAAFAWIQNNGSNDQALFDQDDGTVSVPLVKEAQVGSFSLYPNPAVQDIQVAVTLSVASRVVVDVFSSVGQLLLSHDLGVVEKGLSNHPVTISALANGNYFVRITADRFVKTRQLVITRQ